MAELVLKDVGIFVDGRDLSGDHNALTLTGTPDILDKTTFGSTWRKKVAGLKTVEFNAQGFTNVAKSDPEYGADIASTGVVTITPTGGAVGEPAYMFQSIESNYSPFNSGAVGELCPFDVTLTGAGEEFVKGKVLINTTSLSAATAGTAVAIGAVTTGNFLYGTVHITSVDTTGAGQDIRVAIQTDSSSGFGVSPTTQIAFTSSTGITGEWGTRVAGATTDTWARVNITITSSSASYSVFSAVGESTY